jgi:hypothetical protein
MDKVLCAGSLDASESLAVAQDGEVILIGWQQSDHRAKIGNRTGALIFKKRDKPANTGDVAWLL